MLRIFKFVDCINFVITLFFHFDWVYFVQSSERKWYIIDVQLLLLATAVTGGIFDLIYFKESLNTDNCFPMISFRVSI